MLDREIATVLDIQAWADDPADYDDPSSNKNGHYVVAIGYSTSPPLEAGVALKNDADDLYFYFMDPSLLCRYGYLSWTELDKRWHDNEGSWRKAKPNWHMGIVVDPNGHKVVHRYSAERIG